MSVYSLSQTHISQTNLFPVSEKLIEMCGLWREWINGPTPAYRQHTPTLDVCSYNQVCHKSEHFELDIYCHIHIWFMYRRSQSIGEYSRHEGDRVNYVWRGTSWSRDKNSYCRYSYEKTNRGVGSPIVPIVRWYFWNVCVFVCVCVCVCVCVHKHTHTHIYIYTYIYIYINSEVKPGYWRKERNNV